MKIYSIKDYVADNFDNLMLFVNDGVASRWFHGALLKTEALNAKDLALFQIGEFDCDSAEIKAVIPRLVVSASAFIGDENDSKI